MLLCLLPFRFSWREQAFIAWVGLRGAVPIILALFPWMAGIEDWQTYFNLAFFVVLVSLLLQGWTIAPLARLLKLEVPSRTGRMQRVELGIPGQEEYELVGYGIESDSPIIDRFPGDLKWPGDARPMVIIRDGKVEQLDQVGTLATGDQIYLLARPTDLEKLDRRIVGEREPDRLGERQFFGEFVIQPTATLGALATMYGFTVDDASAALTISEHITERFPHPVVGDRVELGPVQFVVRETDGDHITKVGLKLSRT